MNYSEITPNIYHLSGGFGPQGAIYGSLLVLDDPIILFGASGKDLYRSIKSFFKLKGYTDPKVRIYLPSVTHLELISVAKIMDKLENIEVAVSRDILELVRRPRENYSSERFYDEKYAEIVARMLPKEIDNVVGVGKYDIFQTARSKVIVNPAPGPHKGHSFYLYEESKILASGILGTFLPNSHYYYVDRSSSFRSYREGIEYLENAQYEIHYASYDSVTIMSDENKFISTMNRTMKEIAKEIIECLDVVPCSFDDMFRCWKDQYRPDMGEFQKLGFYHTFVRRHLDLLSSQKLIKVDKSNPDNITYSKR